MMPHSELDILCAKTKGFTSDSRLAGDDLIFVALMGASFDGSAFVESVLKKFPAAYAVTANQQVFSALHEELQSRALLVENAHDAHRYIAKNFRIKFAGKVVAIGGSNGKTSTKDFLFHILSSKFRCIKTQASQNGELGIPKTLEQLHGKGESIDVAVIEVGIDGPGDMIRHAELVRPGIAILTSIGEEHLNLLKSVEGVFREERVLADWCADYGGQVVVPPDEPYLKRLVAEGIAIGAPSPEGKFRHPFAQKHFISNLALCLKTAQLLGMSDEEIQASLATLTVPEGRGVLKQHAANVWLYEDYYNANSSSMRAGIDSAAAEAQRLQLPLRLILGDMFDLGDQEHAVHVQVLEMAIGARPKSLVLIGDRFARAVQALAAKDSVTTLYASQPMAVADKAKLFQDAGVYLIKGSRGMALEHLCR